MPQYPPPSVPRDEESGIWGYPTKKKKNKKKGAYTKVLKMSIGFNVFHHININEHNIRFSYLVLLLSQETFNSLAEDFYFFLGGGRGLKIYARFAYRDRDW